MAHFSVVHRIERLLFVQTSEIYLPNKLFGSVKMWVYSQKIRWMTQPKITICSKILILLSFSFTLFSLFTRLTCTLFCSQPFTKFTLKLLIYTPKTFFSRTVKSSNFEQPLCYFKTTHSISFFLVHALTFVVRFLFYSIRLLRNFYESSMNSDDTNTSEWSDVLVLAFFLFVCFFFSFWAMELEV